jgi:hypothetical protein
MTRLDSARSMIEIGFMGSMLSSRQWLFQCRKIFVRAVATREWLLLLADVPAPTSKMLRRPD